jgi:hypothetical protein
MNSTVSISRAIALGVMAAALPISILAQEDDQGGWNHFGVDFRMGFNIRAKFMNFGVGPPPAAPAAGSAVNRKYNDGFVNVDSSHNAGGVTWNWGYEKSSQIAGDTLQMHANSVSTGAGESRTDDPNLGLELSFVRDVGHMSWGRWGLKAAFGYTDMGFRSSNPLTANGQTITDTYPLNGVKPPVAPYAGSFGGPGPVIGSAPTRSVAQSQVIIAGNRSLEASLYDLRLGPALDVDILQNLSVEISGGLALGVVDSTFAFNETTGSGSSTSGRSHDSGFQTGAYGEAGLAYRVCKSACLFAGAQFQYLGEFNQNVGGRAAQLDLSQSVFCLFGFQTRF